MDRGSHLEGSRLKKTQLLISTMKGLAKFSMFNVHPTSCSQDSGRLGKMIELWQVLYFLDG